LHLKLKTGALYWPQTVSKQPHFPPLAKDVTCDVAVVGAGLTGALIAYTLAKSGFDVVVLDKREVAKGSTSASTALVLYEIDTPLFELMRLRGRKAAVESYRYCLEAISTLERIVAELGDDCEFRRRPSLYLARRGDHVKSLLREFKTRRRFGFDVTYLTREDIRKKFPFSAPGAILSADAADVNPVKLTHQLIKALAKLGGRVFCRTEAVRHTEARDQIIISTSTAHKVKARWMVVASGFETAAATIRQLVKLKSTYAMVTPPQRDFSCWSERCLIWETARPYYYMRTTADDRVIIGGLDANFADARKRDALLVQKARRLSAKLQNLFPDLQNKPALRWAGTFGETKDGLPYIDRARPGSKIFYALCYGANGTNFAVMAAELIRDAILGKRKARARLFAFDR
jgi:glycine/D-amino acid oxidase-like deaminating enzyme